MLKIGNARWNMGLMMALCALPMVGLVAVRVFDLAVSNIVLMALAVACPVSHLLMMRMGMHGHHLAGNAGTNIMTNEITADKEVEVAPTKL